MKVKIEGIEQQLKVEGKSSSRAIGATERPPLPGRRGKSRSKIRWPKS